MPKIKNVNRLLFLLLFSFINAGTHAMEPSATADQRESSEIADLSASLSDTFAKSSSLSLTAGGRSGATLPDDARLFSLPLLGMFESFGFRFATADGGKFNGWLNKLSSLISHCPGVGQPGKTFRLHPG